MLKRNLSIALVLSMILSLLGISNAWASAPVMLDGTTQVMFDQDFSGISSASDLTDFTVSGSSWVYAPDHMIINGSGAGSILTKNSIDVSDAKSWEFTSSQLMVYNSVYWYLGFDGAKGYILRYNQKDKTLSLYKDTTVSGMNSATPVASVSAGNYYEAPYVITVSYDDGTFTVYVQTNSAQKKAMLTYTEPTKTTINGKWGIYNGTKNLSVFHMTLKKTYDSIKVDQWKYDKTFTAENTVKELEDDGFTFSDAPTINSNGLVYKNKTVTFGPNGKDFSGDYYFETQIQRQQNYYTFDFNYTTDGYYRIEYGRIHSNSVHTRPWVRLYKIDSLTKKTHILVDYEKTNIPSGLTRIYKGTVKTLEDGSVDINIDIYNGTALEHTLAYTDTATDTVAVTTTTPVVDENGDPVYEEDGVTQKTETTIENVDTGAPLTSGKLKLKSESSGDKSYVKYLKAYSIMGEDEQGEKIKYTETIIDRTFADGDTKKSVAAEGFTFARYDGDNNATDANGFVLKLNKDYMDYSYAKLGEEYSFTTYYYRSVNYSNLYFNHIDDNNYYRLYVGAGGSSSMYYKLYKKVDGGSEVEIASGSPTWSNHGRNAWSTVTVTLSKNDDGSMKITAYHKQDGKTAMTISYDDVAPLDTGKIRIGTANDGKVKKFAISHTYYESSTNGEEPVFLGRFYNDMGAIKEISKGNIYFEYPTTMLGNYKAVATLYEDYKMTGIKVIDTIDLYIGKVKLFDTTNSTAENMKIRVYFLDENNDLKIVADEVYELN